MQALAQNGNGTAADIDTLNEARKVLVDQLVGTLYPIANNVKIQVEWNPAEVAEDRLIGYETRALTREDFNNDRVDAGDVGAGTAVTAIYEITAPTDGTIASIVSPGVVIPKGAPVATIDPISAGLAVPVNQNDVVLVSSWNVVLGSPVTKGQVIARGAIFNMQPTTAGVGASEPLAGLAFVSDDMADIIKSAPSLTLSAVGTSGQMLTAPVVLLSVGAFPVSESRVALMTGNPYFARNLMKSDRGNTFEVYLGYANVDDYNKVEESIKEGMTPIVVSGAQATLTITEVKTNPLSFLFGSNG